MTIATTLDNGFYETRPQMNSTTSVRVIEVDDDKVQLVNGDGVKWFTVKQFFESNTLIRKLDESETVGL